ncbi:sn-glycerol-3-phosphate ABC transporter permease UgpA [Vibrio sp.]|uniref:sn-glycerol-3-phosphate transport system permease protein UgpA n=1 Tax=Vibrio viridaestus TaxID=2487322 RepID=A0A3N9TJJ6_9VIBR|nr:sn-glycerol-3-phosphate ABC transporter permease UgpA [Vibrio viridaestus]MDC0610342.1 sn-glycerol-3-phosphate ABC transporter permease UgpA [Vibrio sp.]RQW64331.1 sn-glycerol-3-phosphate ABC transporter permease UgpA [Vibrio viridaestus]
MSSQVVFKHRWLPLMLMAPQLLITFVFFLWPAGQAIVQSTQLEDAFGMSTEFVGMENFLRLFSDSNYLESLATTFVFSAAVACLALVSALILAGVAENIVRGALAYRTLLIWPYAVAPVVAGSLWLFLFDPTIGIVSDWIRFLGVDWNPKLNGTQALIMVVIASTWKQVSYNFLFFLAALQSVPKSLHEAAAIDGSGPVRRFLTISFPLITPTSFFLLVVNFVYAFFDTFAVIHAMTQGGPSNSTSTLVYKVYNDGFIGLDMGSSAAQSVILMIIVGLLTVIQFKYVEKKVTY